MWRRLSIPTSVVVTLFVFYLLQKAASENLFFYLSPFVILFWISLLCAHDRFSTVLFGVFYLILGVWLYTWNRHPVFLFLPLVGGLTVSVFFLYLREWTKQIKLMESKKSEADMEVKALRERYEARLESLRHLDDRVGSLLKLFEIARDFNVCLSFSDLRNVVDQRISPELKFTRGALILPPFSGSGMEQSTQHFSFGPQRRTDDESARRFAEKCLNYLNEKGSTKKPGMIRLNGSEAFQEDADKTLWLFHLQVEQHLVAVMAIEGAEESEVPNFEILASQLALQVKKIRLYEMVKEISIVDGLTNVFVRRHFLERFREELKRAIRYRFPLSLLMVDVDDFKSYNDKFGHLVGDRTLREVARIIHDNIRKVDVIGRFGGEEFIIVAPEIEQTKGLELAERIRSSVARKQFRIYDEETRVTVSIGVSSFSYHLTAQEVIEFSEERIEVLIQEADRALYRAKEEGRNRVVPFS